MGGDYYGAPLPRRFQKLRGVQDTGWRGTIRLANAALSYEPLYPVVLVRVEQAEEVDAVLRYGLESAERPQARVAGGAHQCHGGLNAVVVGDRDDLDTVLEAGLYDSVVVLGLRFERRLLVMPLQVRERVDLQGATIEARAVGKLQRSMHGLGQKGRELCPYDSHFGSPINA